MSLAAFLRNVWLEVMDCPVTYFAAEATRSTGASSATGLILVLSFKASCKFQCSKFT